ncbi:MAG: DUF697 domain-containing protein, partial [Planctomycetota bacterium]
TPSPAKPDATDAATEAPTRSPARSASSAGSAKSTRSARSATSGKSAKSAKSAKSTGSARPAGSATSGKPATSANSAAPAQAGASAASAGGKAPAAKPSAADGADRDAGRRAADADPRPEAEATAVGDEPYAGASPRRRRAEDLVQGHAVMSAAAGFIPAPGIDMLVLGGLQVKQIRELCCLYGVPFRARWAQSVLAGLLSGVLPVGAGLGLGSLGKVLPGVGPWLGFAAAPGAAAALTMAVGRLCIQHFERGGGLDDLDPGDHAERFRGLYDRARRDAGE